MLRTLSFFQQRGLYAQRTALLHNASKVPVHVPPDAQLLNDLVFVLDQLSNLARDEEDDKIAEIRKRWNADPLFFIPGGKA